MNRPTTARARRAARALRLAFLLVATAVSLPACGKKGPPLPPLVRVPSRPEGFAARRLGNTVYLQVTIPGANSDGTSPADIERVDVYGFTGAPEGNEGIFKDGMLVASIPVRKPAEPAPAEATKGDPKKTARPQDLPPSPPRPPASMENGFDQGDVVVVSEPLGPAQFAEVVPKKKPAKVVAPVEPEGPRPLGPAPRVALPSRLYIAVGVNRKGQKGAVSGRQQVLLTEAPPAPSAPEVTYGETSFSISWESSRTGVPPVPSAGVPPAEDKKLPVLKGTPIGTLPVTSAFNVYQVPAAAQPLNPAPGQPSRPPAVPPAVGGRMPTPLNDKPLLASPFVDKGMEFGKPRCYALRAVTVFGTQPVESEASPAACVTPADTFPPAAPASLKAVGSEGAISLVWDANTEADLAGYIVLRAPLPGSDFKPITGEPVKEAAFNDTTAARGVRYAYVIVAVDNAGNRSLRSNQVEEAAR